MNCCPHCGAELSENARFCPHCMTALNEKRVIPTPKYPPLRWLSAIAAVLVLCVAVWSGLHLWPQEAQDADAILQPTTTTVITATPATATATTATTAPIIAPIQTTTAEKSATTLSTATDTSVPTTTAPATTQTTTATKERPSTTVKPTTTKTTTATTAPAYPASWDEQGPYYTEDGQVFEDVDWTYRSAGNSLRVANSGFAEYNTFTKTYLYDIPLSECIIITGFKKPASNGCYRIPPTIDGKVVVAVDMQKSVEGAYQFNDEDVAPTVRVITFPPELLVVFPHTFDQCTDIEHAYFSGAKLLMYPSAVPTDTGINHNDSLQMHDGYRTRMLYDPYAGEYSVLKDYCEYIVDPGVGVTYGERMHYPGVCWWPTDIDFNSLYPDWWTEKHG